MTIQNIIDAIAQKHRASGIVINGPASPVDIDVFEQQIGFSLPADFKEFYSICNGLSCDEYIFNIIPLADITRDPQNYGPGWFYFSEYMIYSDMWGLRLTAQGTYDIFNGSYPTTAITSSLKEFLERFFKGKVFEEGGLYDWNEI